MKRFFPVMLTEQVNSNPGKIESSSVSTTAQALLISAGLPVTEIENSIVPFTRTASEIVPTVIEERPAFEITVLISALTTFLLALK